MANFLFQLPRLFHLLWAEVFVSAAMEAFSISVLRDFVSKMVGVHDAGQGLLLFSTLDGFRLFFTNFCTNNLEVIFMATKDQTVYC